MATSEKQDFPVRMKRVWLRDAPRDPLTDGKVRE